ncbi:MAG: right-handed parallel beta-helix repeat-containing protein, partial [Algoriphagus sp.]|uniref:right-handed parallel beta-helix repeat-containing protein n=1 Tax=Algoriphagus sp. TaxID=1872435 RepID=UPI00260447FC
MRNFYVVKKSFLLPVLVGIFFQFLVGGYQAKAQGLTGTYSIGPVGDFSNFNNAISALNTNGVSGPVIFNVEDGTYNEQIVLGPITGSSLSNTITFQSQSGNATNVVLTHAAIGLSDNYVILLENASHFIVKNLTIKATGTTYSRTIRGQVELHNILFEGNVFQSPITASISGDRGNVIISASTSSDVRFINNAISGGSYGVFYQGTNSSSVRAFGFRFISNSISEVYYRGISFSRFLDSEIEGNTIILLSASQSGSVGMELTNIDGETRVVQNRIAGSKSTALEYTFSNGSGTTSGLIANNYIQSSGSYALYFYYNTNQRIYHNSMNSTGTGVAMHYNGTASSNNLVKNNILKANSGYSVEVTNSTGLVEMD